MKLRAVASLLLASTILVAAGSASAQAADTSRVLGLRFEATLFNPFDVRGISNLDPESGPTSPRIDVFRPNGDIRIGYDLPMGLTPLIGFGLRSHSQKQFQNNDDLAFGEGRTDIVLSAELRYYFGAHKRGLQPFVFGEWNTTIASFGTELAEGAPVEEKNFFDDVNETLGDINSVMNINAGLGLEYKFARSFGIGAKWGFGLSLAPSDRHTIREGGETIEVPSTSNTVFGTSSSIYAAFRI
jgi:hypothetical protein